MASPTNELELALMHWLSERRPDRVDAAFVMLSMASNLVINDAVARGYMPLKDDINTSAISGLFKALSDVLEDGMKKIKRDAVQAN